jgi:hypothetical protein
MSIQYRVQQLKDAGIPLWAFLLMSVGNFILFIVIMICLEPLKDIIRVSIILFSMWLMGIIIMIYTTYAPAWTIKKKVKR